MLKLDKETCQGHFHSAAADVSWKASAQCSDYSNMSLPYHCLPAVAGPSLRGLWVLHISVPVVSGKAENYCAPP